MEGLLIKTDGTEQTVKSAGKTFNLKELQEFVGGTIDFVSLRNGKVMIVNDNGKLDKLPVNEKASQLFRKAYPLDQFPENNDGTIVGDVLVKKGHNA